MHLFTVVLYYAYMQFKIYKKLAVQTQICNGKFVLQEYKLSEINKEIKVLKERYDQGKDDIGSAECH